MIGTLLPAAVVVETTRAQSLPGRAFPQEVAAVRRAVQGRRDEFLTVRILARRALAQLGFPPCPLLPGERGAPRWPTGVVGSLTHTTGFRAAAVASAQAFASIGIDAEPAGPLPAGVLGLVASDAERQHLAELTEHDGQVPWDRLLFAAKEAVYKTWFPLTHRFLEFGEAALSFDPERQTFRARLLAGPASVDGRQVRAFTGRWSARDGLVLTAIALPRGNPAPAQPCRQAGHGRRSAAAAMS
jgi:4'-phosphopantetheinyl transferase EntD